MATHALITTVQTPRRGADAGAGTGRRSLAAGAMLALLARPAKAAEAIPDAELLAACAGFDRLARVFNSTCENCSAETEADDEAHFARLNAITMEQRPFLDRMCSLPCQTPAGVLALQRSLAVFNGPSTYRDEPDGYADDRLMAAILRAVKEGAAGSAPNLLDAPQVE